jgi:hypothetical protein
MTVEAAWPALDLLRAIGRKFYSHHGVGTEGKIQGLTVVPLRWPSGQGT